MFAQRLPKLRMAIESEAYAGTSAALWKSMFAKPLQDSETKFALH